MGKTLGDDVDPLLVSVRSGAPFSMPGMMDTVLNLGLNDVSVAGLAKQTENQRFAYDSYRRFVQMFGKIVLDIDGDLFEHALEELREEQGVATDPELDAAALRSLVETFKQIVRTAVGNDFPQDPQEQLRFAIEAVFRSWDGERARVYRKMEKIPDDLGTAVNVQTMVFGNKGDDSGTGVAFTRDPATGEKRPYGDFLRNAQGEDVVAGIRATEPLDAMATVFPESSHPAPRADADPRVALSGHVRHRVHDRAASALPPADARRQAPPRPRCAWRSRWRPKADRQARAVLRVQPEQLDQLLHPQFDPGAELSVVAKGLNASPGAAVGKAVFTADDAEAQAAAGQQVILVRPETSPDDLHGMIAAEGILTSRGGLVSHAAVVARGMGTPAVCGASELEIDVQGKQFAVGDTVVREGDVISINGTTGEIVLGAVPVITPEPSGPFEVVLGWADEIRTLGVRTNADLPHDAQVARALRRRGHRPLPHRAHVPRRPAADRPALHPRGRRGGRADALDELEALQRADYIGILEAMDGLPVTVRLLDPPLHEFLPDIEELLVRDAKGELDAAGRELLRAAQHWREANPMLGTRGVRLGVLKPELYRTQVKALFDAAIERRKAGGDPRVEVMIPLSVSGPSWRSPSAGCATSPRTSGCAARTTAATISSARWWRHRAPRSSPTRSPSSPTSSRSAPTTSRR